MRIERVRVNAFGRLTDFDTGLDPLGPLVVVLGPNEAGKSTLFHFLATALYGFQPASRDTNPHVPWGSTEAGGSIRLRLGGDQCVEVGRKLRSQPHGTMTIDGVAQEIRNRPVPWVAHIPRTVFRQVFAVTLADLAGLDEETWARIQDRVVGSMGATDLHPARGVAEALEREAGELWRPNRRGNQRLRDLQDEIRALRVRRKEALERDRWLRSLVEEREITGTSLQERREDRQRDRVALERIQSLMPVRSQLIRIASLRDEGGAKEDLEGIPRSPRARFEELGAKLETLRERVGQIERETAEPEEAISRFDAEAARTLDRRDEVSRFVARATSVGADRARTRDLASEVRELELRLETTAGEVLSIPWSEAPEEGLLAIPIALLRERVERAEEARRMLATRAARLDSSPPSVGMGRPDRRISALMLLLGIPLLTWGVAGGGLLLTAIGAALCAVGLTSLVIRTQQQPHTALPDEDEGILFAERAAAQSGVVELLGGLPIRPEYLEAPGSTLVAGFERLQELAHDHRQRSRSWADALERLAAVDSEGHAIAGTLGLKGDFDPDSLANVLDTRVRKAERIRDAAKAAERELRRLRRERSTVAAELEGVERELQAIVTAVSAFGHGDIETGLEDVGRRLKAHQRADQLEDELERAHPELGTLKTQIKNSERSGESWTVDDEDLAHRRTRIERLGEEIETLVSRAEALEQQIGQLRDKETVDAVDSENASLCDDEARFTRERDRKWVLAQLIREADRKFREEHQPDLLRRAGSYLEHLTSGRYDKLLVDETATGDLFQVVGPNLPVPIALKPPVSTGTLEQAYLSLRLAIVDHLDQGGERLPLFIDEVFVNWDSERRARGLEVVSGLSQERQLFVFTCYPEVADDLAKAGGRVLQLQRAHE